MVTEEFHDKTGAAGAGVGGLVVREEVHSKSGADGAWGLQLGGRLWLQKNCSGKLNGAGGRDRCDARNIPKLITL